MVTIQENNKKYSAAVITVSDSCYEKTREDLSGPTIKQMLTDAGYDVVYYSIVPDEVNDIEKELIKCSDSIKVELCITTGGTGFSKRDVTPEATKKVVEKETPGIPEAMRAASMAITPKGCLSREFAGIRNETLIINCPGSVKACKETLSVVLPAISHGIEMMLSKGSNNCGN